MKKLLCVILVAISLFTFASCGTDIKKIEEPENLNSASYYSRALDDIYQYTAMEENKNTISHNIWFKLNFNFKSLHALDEYNNTLTELSAKIKYLHSDFDYKKKVRINLTVTKTNIPSDNEHLPEIDQKTEECEIIIVDGNTYSQRTTTVKNKYGSEKTISYNKDFSDLVSKVYFWFFIRELYVETYDTEEYKTSITGCNFEKNILNATRNIKVFGVDSMPSEIKAITKVKFKKSSDMINEFSFYLANADEISKDSSSRGFQLRVDANRCLLGMIKLPEYHNR